MQISSQLNVTELKRMDNIAQINSIPKNPIRDHLNFYYFFQNNFLDEKMNRSKEIRRFLRIESLESEKNESRRTYTEIMTVQFKGRAIKKYLNPKKALKKIFAALIDRLVQENSGCFGGFCGQIK